MEKSEELSSALIDDLSHNDFWREETKGYPQFCHSFLYGFVDSKRYFKNTYKNVYLFFDKDYFYEITPMDGKEAIRKEVIKLYNDKEKFILTLGKFMNDKEVFYSMFKDDYSSDDIASTYRDFMKQFSLLISFSLISEGFDHYTDDILPVELCRDLGISISQAHEIVSVLSFPSEPTFVTMELIDSLRESPEAHSKRYFWVQNNFHTMKYLDAAYFRGRKETIDPKAFKEHVSDIIRKKEEIYAKYSLDRDLFELLSFLSTFQDRRKETFLIGNHYLSLILKEISRRTGESYANLLYYTPDETISLINNGIKLDMAKRKDFSLYYYDGKVSVFGGDDARKIFKYWKRYKPGEEIKGFVASAPVDLIEGRIKIVLDAHSSDISEGDILVASSTRPEFLPLMKKALAIVTNEGGITSHAAIVSRELAKPCIIGTKVATYVLKDGDLIRMDMKTGKIWVITS